VGRLCAVTSIRFGSPKGGSKTRTWLIPEKANTGTGIEIAVDQKMKTITAG